MAFRLPAVLPVAGIVCLFGPRKELHPVHRSAGRSADRAGDGAAGTETLFGRPPGLSGDGSVRLLHAGMVLFGNFSGNHVRIGLCHPGPVAAAGIEREPGRIVEDLRMRCADRDLDPVPGRRFHLRRRNGSGTDDLVFFVETDTCVWTWNRPDRDPAADLQLLRFHVDFRDAPFCLFTASESGRGIHDQPAEKLQFLSVSAVSAVLGAAESGAAVGIAGKCGAGSSAENPPSGGMSVPQHGDRLLRSQCMVQYHDAARGSFHIPVAAGPCAALCAVSAVSADPVPFGP